MLLPRHSSGNVVRRRVVAGAAVSRGADLDLAPLKLNSSEKTPTDYRSRILGFCRLGYILFYSGPDA